MKKKPEQKSTRIEVQRARSVECRLFRFLMLLGIFTTLVIFPAAGFSEEKSGISYKVTIEGVADDSLHTLLKEVSKTAALEDRPPAVQSLLQKRVDEDIPELLKALHSLGYYGAQVKAQIREATHPVQVIFQVDTGHLYLIKSVDIRVVGDNQSLLKQLPTPKELGLIEGEPGQARAVLDAQDKLLAKTRESGFPFPRIAERKVVVNHADHSMTISFLIDPGKEAHFGSVTIHELKTVNESYVRKKIPWKEGELFDAELVQEAHEKLVKTGLFTMVRVSTADNVSNEGLVPMSIDVTERKPRTVKAGVNYATDKGIGGKVSWEHRNVFGNGERFMVGAKGSQIDYGMETEFEKPEFLGDDQSLLFKGSVAEDSPDGYTSRNVSISALVQRTLREGMVIGGGPAFKFSEVDQLDESNNFNLLFLPAFFNWDRSDDLLNPTRGGRLQLQLAPYYEMMNSLTFLKQYLVYSHYFQVSESPWIVLAGRGAVGTLSGTPRDDIPADERFYAGGGGSIRGYPYQTVGPLFEDDTPIGGRSIVELSFETRFKITESIGMVAFLDGGSVFEASYPDFAERCLRWGTGLGFRYYTPIGPLRLDAAVPLNKRSGVDNSFEVYLSIGQAF